MTDIDTIAKEIVTTVPVGQLTVESFIPVIGYLCSHLSEVRSLDGPQKKKIVIRCLDIAVDQMGFPQKAILRPLVDSVAPPAIDALIKAAKTVEIDVAHVFSVSRATVLSKKGDAFFWRRQERGETPLSLGVLSPDPHGDAIAGQIPPQETEHGATKNPSGVIFETPQAPKIAIRGFDRPRRWRIPATGGRIPRPRPYQNSISTTVLVHPLRTSRLSLCI